MGADMIGYQAMFPTEFTEDEKEKLNKHLDTLIYSIFAILNVCTSFFALGENAIVFLK